MKVRVDASRESSLSAIARAAATPEDRVPDHVGNVDPAELHPAAFKLNASNMVPRIRR